MIKRTFLVRDESSSISALKEITGEEWYAIISKNKDLPPSERRYFVTDLINDGKSSDVMIMETARDDYIQWRRETKRRERNIKAKEGMQLYSIEAEAEIEKSALLSEAMIAPDELEEQVHSILAVGSLKEKLTCCDQLSRDLFECYQRGEKRSCTKQLARKYEVSEVTIRKRKIAFEKFCKNFFEN